MGERLKVIAKGCLGENQIEIELNIPHTPGAPRDVHIQTSKGRLNMNEKEYLRLAFQTLRAKSHLKAMKGEGG